MEGQMQRGPPDYSNDFFGFADYTEVLHDHTFNVDSNIFSEAQSPQAEADEGIVIPYNIRLATSCLETGIGIESWALHKAWPGICNKLWWFDFYHPHTIHPATIASINAMLAGEENGSRKFDCPVFVAESRHGWPRTCNNVKSPNMAELRRHLTTRAGRGYTPQLSFLELCPTCNEDFLDKGEFQSRHGYKGEFCTTRRPQRRWPHSRVQWELLYGKVEAAMAVQRLSSNQVDLEPTPPQAVPPVQDPAPHDEMEEPAPEPTNDQQDHAMPYLTPYQLIFDSDSDEGRTATSPDCTSVSSASGPEQSIPTLSMLHRPEWEPAWSAYEPRTHFLTTYHDFTSSWTSFAQYHTPMMGQTSSYASYRHLDMSEGASYSPVLGPSSDTDYEDDTEVNPMESVWQRAYDQTNDQEHDGSQAHSWGQDSEFQAQSLQSSSQVDSDTQLHHAPPNLLSDPLRCNIDGCGQRFTGLYRHGNLGRHKRQKHGRGKPYVCEDNTCAKEFKRQDARLKHYRKRHPELAAPRMSQPMSTRSIRDVELSDLAGWAS